MPWPSATTTNRGRVLEACTGRVTLLVGGCDRQTAASSLVGRIPDSRAGMRTRSSAAHRSCRRFRTRRGWKQAVTPS
jgi:hypothetical protein